MENEKSEMKSNIKEIHEHKNKELEKIIFPENTMIGALSKYIQTPNENFQPMNANFGILPELRRKN